METVVGVFHSRDDAARAANQLLGLEVSMLIPGATEAQMAAVQQASTEQPGMGKAIGGVVGGAIGAAGGLELGALAATGLIPGVGPVVAIGVAAAAVLGLAGSVAGAAGGAAIEEHVNGLPEDEIYVYHDALQKGRSVLFVEASTDHPADEVREVLTREGAESIDAARDEWWIGLRSAEQEHYEASGGSFAKAEPAYRAGFEAALHRKDPKVVRAAIAKYATSANQEAFRRGYERGQAHRPSHARPSQTEQARLKADESVDEASEESFPASDPPSH